MVKMSDNDLTEDMCTLYSQSFKTARDYLGESVNELSEYKHKWTMRDAVELAKVMAMDFNTAMVSMKLQQIRDAIRDGK